MLQTPPETVTNIPVNSPKNRLQTKRRRGRTFIFNSVFVRYIPEQQRNLLLALLNY